MGERNHAVEILTKEIIPGRVQEETTKMIYQKVGGNDIMSRGSFH